MRLSYANGIPTPKDNAVKILESAYEMRYNFFDTAGSYIAINPDKSISYNGKIVKEAIKPFRDKVISCIKFDDFLKKIRVSIEKSLKRL